MENSITNSHIKWTGADLISSYRFWGIALFLLFIWTIPIFFTHYLPFFKNENSLSNAEVGTIMSSRAIGLLFAIIPAWMASRCKKVYPLYILGLLMLISCLAIYVNVPYGGIILANFSIMLVISCVSLLMLAYIAQATRSVEAVIFLFGMISASRFILVALIPLFIKDFIDVDFMLVIVIVAFIGLLLLLPINRNLFNKPPRNREVQGIRITYKNPVVTFFLFFIPFYFIFWLVRIHREIRSFSQSATLLTPWAAGWSAIFVPFAIPFMLMSLNDIVEQPVQKNKGQTWLILLFSFIYLPISAAMTQSRLNRLANNNNR